MTVRNGRYVIPVKQEYKAMFPGIVHDQSASGATVFIEPMAVVELNNQLRSAEAEEEEEVRRVLSMLSGLVGEEAAGIAATLGALAELDLAFAKGRLSLEMGGDRAGGQRPGLAGTARRAASAPRGARSCRSTSRSGEDFDTLVITGPNTGGKTVTLKTIGLLTLMAQSGLHIPARVGSAVAVFATRRLRHRRRAEHRAEPLHVFLAPDAHRGHPPRDWRAADPGAPRRAGRGHRSRPRAPLWPWRSSSTCTRGACAPSRPRTTAS